MPACKYRRCDIEFKIDPNKRGVRQQYCSYVHKRYEAWHVHHDKKAREQAEYARKQQKARNHAILHCAEYLICLDKLARNGNRSVVQMNCYQCDKSNMKENSYMLELDIVVDDDSEYVLYLPKVGT